MMERIHGKNRIKCRITIWQLHNGATLQLDTSTLSRNVKPLQAHGWLEVVPEEDARAQPFRLTRQGKRLIERAVPAWEEAQRRATELLGDEGIALLDRAAKKLRQPKAEG